MYSEGPWVIMDRSLTLRKWEPDSKLSEAEEITTGLRVRFPQFSTEYYDNTPICDWETYQKAFEGGHQHFHISKDNYTRL